MVHPIIKSILLPILTTILFCSSYLISTSLFAGKYSTEIFELVKTKDLLTMSQVFGYFVGKILGAIYLSSIRTKTRFIWLISLLVLSASIFIPFAYSPPILQSIFVFIGAIPLSLLWGFVIFYIEGHPYSDVMIMILYMGLIASSGIAKTIAVYIMKIGISEDKMPCVCSAIGLAISLVTAITLEQLTQQHIASDIPTAHRQPASLSEQKQFFCTYWAPLVGTGVVYGVLLGYRNYRDYYAYELFVELYGTNFEPSYYIFTDMVVSVFVTFSYMMLCLIHRPIVSVYVLYCVMCVGGIIIGLGTIGYSFGLYSGIYWVIIIGIGATIAYIPPGALLYDKFMSAVGQNITSVFLIYQSDIYGQLATYSLIILKGTIAKSMTYSRYLTIVSYITASIVIPGMIFVIITFASFNRIDNARKASLQKMTVAETFKEVNESNTSDSSEKV